jgi:hypothetical protein
MDSNWAADHLQTIRTLMERSALYRRALAPIMMLSGAIGIVAAILPCFVVIQSNRQFCLYWMTTSIVAIISSFLLARRQALKDHEPFWSPPTKRVTQALMPAFCFGLIGGVSLFALGPKLPELGWSLACLWIVTYGFALHAAGFFMQRGIKIFGWLFILGGSGTLFAALLHEEYRTAAAGHYAMGIAFGVIHMAYGAYLYYTEKSKSAS